MAIRSTIPGAISAVAGYMATIQAANPALNLGIYPYGLPVESNTNNAIALGDWESGAVVAETSTDWAAIPANARLRTEEYALQGTIMCSAGDGGEGSAQQRVLDAYTIWDAFLEQIILDPSGGGNLSPSGSWGKCVVVHHFSGPASPAGWTVTIGFQLHVINVQLQG